MRSQLLNIGCFPYLQSVTLNITHRFENCQLLFHILPDFYPFVAIFRYPPFYVVAGVYARELYEPDNLLKVGDITGTVISVTSTCLVLQTDDGKKVTIPNSRLLEEQVEILS